MAHKHVYAGVLLEIEAASCDVALRVQVLSLDSGPATGALSDQPEGKGWRERCNRLRGAAARRRKVTYTVLALVRSTVGRAHMTD